MRELRYSVAASLDGYIAGPNGEYDWIVVDPEIDFDAMYASFGGLVMGRKSYEVSLATGTGGGPEMPIYVYSRICRRAPARASPSPVMQCRTCAR